MRPSSNPAAEIRQALRSYRRRTGQLRRRLKALGFDVVENRRHVRLVSQSNPRISIVIPTSGSDYRGGRNSASNLLRKIQEDQSHQSRHR